MTSEDLYPKSNVMRVLFLYVGQGEATLFLVPDGLGGHISMLVDCNYSPSLNGIDLPCFLADTLPKNSKGRPVLDLFVNTHPHSDHLGGLKALRQAIEIQNVWHSGHNPGREHGDAYKELQTLMKEVEDRKGKVEELQGSRTAVKFGAAEVHILAPAEYVKDEIADEKAETRYQRIHEHCAVLRVRYGSAGKKVGVLVTGDADKAAWENHITDYHGAKEENRLKSEILSASHHGSRTFFKTDEDDDKPYTKHLDYIQPERLVISAPAQKDSPHDHPHDDALELYQTYIETDCIHHMGAGRWSFQLDVDDKGDYELEEDRGKIADEYPASDDDEKSDKGGGSGGTKATIASTPISRVGKTHPMGMPSER
ncbi:MAG: MBL fold metallo-hydrolase [Deltaproteobacteria bacterium]|nr:MBL fold metallo-hydrolase [Deltaproteobacteria bacterium]